MDKFVPYEKLSKKKKRELDKIKRSTWQNVSPVTRISKNAKIYNRKKSRKCANYDSFGIFYISSLFLTVNQKLAVAGRIYRHRAVFVCTPHLCA